MTTEQLNSLLERRSVWLAIAGRKATKDLAEDILQEALIRAIKWEGEIDNLMPWFQSILYNQCSEFWRRRYGTGKHSPGKGRDIQMAEDPDKYLSLEAPESYNADVWLELEEEQREEDRKKKWLYGELAKFRPQLRQSVMNFAQTGRIDYSNGTDRVRLWRAVRRLRASAHRAGFPTAEPGQFTLR